MSAYTSLPFSTPSEPSVREQLRNFLRSSSGGSLTSITTTTAAEWTSSSSVERNASTMYAGRPLMNPTVSESRNVSPPARRRLIVVESVVNRPGDSGRDSPVSALNSVVLPADVYPASETVRNPCRALDWRCSSRCLPAFASLRETACMRCRMSSRYASASNLPIPMNPGCSPILESRTFSRARAIS